MAGNKKRARQEVAEVESDERMSNKDYLKELYRLHVELVKLQEWVLKNGTKVCVVFEGRDGAGKGGTIKALTERVSPRVFRVVALPAPTDREKTQMYVQRYLPHLPAAGVPLRNFSTCSSVQKPITRSTPARLYQLRSKMTISPAAAGAACSAESTSATSRARSARAARRRERRAG